MTVRTRYFVIVSLLVLTVGLGTGLVAYYVGFPATAFFSSAGPEELRYMPSTAAVVGYVEVRQIMASDLRQRLRQGMGGEAQDNGRREFQDLTGINFETDVEHMVGCIDSSHTTGVNNSLVFARGVFAPPKIEGLMREHGAQVLTYKGVRLIEAGRLVPDVANDAQGAPGDNVERRDGKGDLAVAFIEPGLAAIGGKALVEHAIDLHTGGGESAATNDDLIARVKGLDGGHAWVVGRMDALRGRANLPEEVVKQIPAITWFTASGRVDGGLQARLTAETRDEDAANMLRDVVRGFLALARLQTGTNPDFKRFVDSLQLGGTGTTVSLSLDVPAQVFDLLGAARQRPKPR
jgi:hypothetical protein